MYLKDNIDLQRLPKHIAIIMDGNGRWAEEKGQDRLYGHFHGVESVRNIVEGCAELGVEYLTLYAFSTENWDRPLHEVTGLMELLVETIRKDTSDDSGARAKGFEAVVKDGALDLKWNWKVSIVEDAEPELVEVEAIWEVQENGVELHVVLLNGGIVAQERAAIKRVVDLTVASLTGVLGQDEVPFLYVD
jgi:undecaprenyl pyrophosphate synthase